MTNEQPKFGKKEIMNERIESERLLIVPISPKYRNDIFKEFTPEITALMYPSPAKDISETDAFIEESTRKNKEGGNFQAVILDKKTEEFLGNAGLHDIGTRTPELGVWIKKSSHGRGYGKEAMAALKEWAEANLDYDYILYPVVDENIASRKIPESFGAKVEREYDTISMSGAKHHMMEYRIYPNKQ